MPANERGFSYDDDGPFITKDPDAVLDYLIDFGVDNDSWLGEDTIATVTWSIDPAGELAEVVDKRTQTTTTVTIWLEGGTVGATYTVTAHIVTSAGREEDRSFRVIIAER